MKFLLTLALMLSATDDVARAGASPCVGDCDADGVIVVSEVITGVNIALGNSLVELCAAFDRNSDGLVGIDELIASVGGLLGGCTPVIGGGLRLEAVGGEFRVNADPDGLRVDSQVAIDDAGDFVAAWGFTKTSEDDSGIAARRFLSDGTPASPTDFAVNIFTVDLQRTHDVAMQPDGSFMIVWETSGFLFRDPEEIYGIWGRRFDSGGVPLGRDFKVNSFNDFREDVPVVAALADGGYIVIWTIRENVIAGTVDLRAQRFDAAGQAVGEEFLVNTYTEGPQSRPAVAALPDGGFVVVWEDAYRDGLDTGIFGQRFDSGAAPAGSDFLVNTYTFSQQRRPSVAAASDGSFLVTWGGILVGDEQIVARRFASTGQPVGTEFEVNNSGQLGQQGYPSVAAEPQGGFLVTWESGGSIGPFNIFARRVDRDGAPADTEFQVNTFTSNMYPRTFPEVAINAGGDVVVVWDTPGQDGGPTDFSIRAQRYRLVER